MAKRSAFHYRAPRAKMPRLNITIQSNDQETSNGLGTQRERVAAIARPQPIQSEDMWPDDDDDELVMLASQAAEKVEKRAEILSQAISTSLNYDQFRLGPHSSTQMAKPNNDVDDIMCVDEEIFAGIPDCDIMPAPVVAPPKEKPPVVSKPPAPVPSTSAAMNAATVASNHQKIENAKISAQNTFFSNKMRDQKKEIESLKEALAKLNDKCQTKEGEVNHCIVHLSRAAK